jgi:molecular chaperone GrpE
MSDDPLQDENALGGATAPDDVAAPPGAPPTTAELEARIVELEVTQARAIADYRNLERRTTEARGELRRVTTASVVINLLPVHDDLSRAIEAVADDIAEHEWVAGIQLIRDKFSNVLGATGAQEIEALGKPFDPRFHEAMGSPSIHASTKQWATPRGPRDRSYMSCSPDGQSTNTWSDRRW